jgi:hypothetical protein
MASLGNSPSIAKLTLDRENRHTRTLARKTAGFLVPLPKVGVNYIVVLFFKNPTYSIYGEGGSRPGGGKFAKAPRDPYQQQQSRKSCPRGHDKEAYPAHLVCKPSA